MGSPVPLLRLMTPHSTRLGRLLFRGRTELAHFGSLLLRPRSWRLFSRQLPEPFPWPGLPSALSCFRLFSAEGHSTRLAQAAAGALCVVSRCVTDYVPPG